MGKQFDVSVTVSASDFQSTVSNTGDIFGTSSKYAADYLERRIFSSADYYTTQMSASMGTFRRAVEAASTTLRNVIYASSYNNNQRGGIYSKATAGI
ncbi:unnamed protein product, partial [marine sediment metagenome]